MNEYTVFPVAVTPGWDAITLLGTRQMHEGKHRPSDAIVFYPDGRAAFRHLCDRGSRGVIICAPFLQLDNGGHEMVSRYPLTISPSILCPDCGTHGFVRDGNWVSA